MSHDKLVDNLERKKFREAKIKQTYREKKNHAILLHFVRFIPLTLLIFSGWPLKRGLGAV